MDCGKNRTGIGGLGKEGKLLVTKHHMAHAASAFYPSPYEEAMIIDMVCAVAAFKKKPDESMEKSEKHALPTFIYNF